MKPSFDTRNNSLFFCSGFSWGRKVIFIFFIMQEYRVIFWWNWIWAANDITNAKWYFCVNYGKSSFSLVWLHLKKYYCFTYESLHNQMSQKTKIKMIIPPLTTVKIAIFKSISSLALSDRIDKDSYNPKPHIFYRISWIWIQCLHHGDVGDVFGGCWRLLMLVTFLRYWC